MTRAMDADLPLVYACSGCPQGARAAQQAAQELATRGAAAMSCMTGIATTLPRQRPPVDRPVIVFDGCREHCTLERLMRTGVKRALHYDLGGYPRGLSRAQLAKVVDGAVRDLRELNANR